MDLCNPHKLNRSFTSTDYSFSFPKSQRFRRLVKEKTSTFYTIPTGFNKRSTSFGFGRRSELILKTDAPSPDKYNPDINDSRGITISRAGKGGRLKTTPVNSPGPGTYSITPNQEGPKYTMFQKYSKKVPEETPSSFNYNPNFKIGMKNNYGGIGFGFGKKREEIKKDNSPGPGSYSLPVFFPKLIQSKPHSFNKSQKVLKKKLVIK